ncbi:MAG: hypothetical protein EHM48_06690, partial [Planctomycetaceae bacterium]
MPRMVRRHWFALLVHMVAITVAVVWIVNALSRGASPAIAQAPVAGVAGGEVAGVDAVAYACVGQLREELALTNADLAAMGCGQAQAEEVLGALKGWALTHDVQWQQQQELVGELRNALRQTYRRINVGPKDQGVIRQLPRQKEQFAAAKAQSRKLIE